MTNSNYGKITWKQLKPIIQGKIVYGPDTEKNKEIIKNANTTFSDMNRLKEFAKSIDKSLKMLKTDEEFKEKFNGLLDLIKLPFVQAAVGGAVDIDLIEGLLKSILTDTNISNVVEVISNLLDCFSVDRFVAVNSEKELEDMAQKLNDKKMYYAGVYFNENSTEKEITYSIRMDRDNTPITSENKYRFQFPGPESDFALQMRYHRGFIQIQHSIDTGIIKMQKNTKPGFLEALQKNKDNDFTDQFTDFDEDDDFDFKITTTDEDDSSGITTESPTTMYVTEGDDTETTEVPLTKPGVLELIKNTFNTTDIKFADGTSLDDFLDFKNEPNEGKKEVSREKRSPQFDGLLGLLFGGGKEKEKGAHYSVDDVKIYTKQFPYPKYKREE